MKRIFSKTYRFGRLSVSILMNEWIFLYRGNSRVIIKEIRTRDLFTTKMKIAYGAAAVLLALSVFLFRGPAGEVADAPTPQQTAQNDEDRKNRILQSRPKKKVKLVIRQHRVKKNESPARIAKKYGISLDTLCGSNNLNSYDYVKEGTVLKIPNKDGVLYRVKKGEKMVSVAQKYKASLPRIIAENNIKNPDFFAPDSIIFIPDAKPLDIVPGFLWPSMDRGITSGYGWRVHPIDRVRHFHLGLDMRSNYQWIKSTKYGQVTYTGWMGGYGKTVIISHPGGWKSLYAHLSRIIVRTGQYVKQGQFVAKSGNTGNSTGAHLHFELIKNGHHVNPYAYLVKKKR